MSSYTIVIPVLNDAQALARLLRSRRAARHDEASVVADGGSLDDSVTVAKTAGCQVIECGPGRATQLRAAIEVATGSWIWMLHADTVVSLAAADEFRRVARASDPCWGRFDVCLDAAAPVYRVIESLMNVRSALTGICTGDQGIFVHATLLAAIGGVPEQPLMEDIELSRRLKRRARPRRIRIRLVTSARRWQVHGAIRTVLLMWSLRLAYFVGVSPARLHRIYYRG